MHPGAAGGAGAEVGAAAGLLTFANGLDGMDGHGAAGMANFCRAVSVKRVSTGRGGSRGEGRRLAYNEEVTRSSPVPPTSPLARPEALRQVTLRLPRRKQERPPYSGGLSSGPIGSSVPAPARLQSETRAAKGRQRQDDADGRAPHGRLSPDGAPSNRRDNTVHRHAPQNKECLRRRCRQPGGLGSAPKIPGFASPPLDGFADEQSVRHAASIAAGGTLRTSVCARNQPLVLIPPPLRSVAGCHRPAHGRAARDRSRDA